MNNEIEQKKTWKIVILYIFLLMLGNAIGAFLPAEFNFPFSDRDSYIVWHTYYALHRKLIDSLDGINYFIPILLCIIYINPKDKTEFPSRFINMPYRFAGLGCIGWFIVFVKQSFFLIYVKVLYKIKIAGILFDGLVFSVFMSFFCFTISFFLMETIHRRFILIKFFPNGNLSKYSVKHRAGLFLKFRNLFFSVSICPIVFLLARYLSITKRNGIQAERDVIIVFWIFMIIGVILLLLGTRYISRPLAKFQKGVVRIQKGNYDERIDFIANDIFGDLADAFNDMTAALKEKTTRISAIQDSIIRGMAIMVESRDINTGGHINRTSAGVMVFVRKLQAHPDYSHISYSFFENIIKAAPMHDLGKIAVSDAVLRKPGKFTAEEYEVMKTHASEGAKIVSQVIGEVEDEEFKKIAINVAHYHHEKWNGEGYPCRLKGEEIPLEARIMALADVFDALVSKRCYKDSFSYDKAFTIIEESLGSHFDPFLGIQFLDCRKELEELYKLYQD